MRAPANSCGLRPSGYKTTLRSGKFTARIMSTPWMIAIFFLFGVATGANHCHRKLGNDNRSAQFTCNTIGRTRLQVDWFKDGAILDTTRDKYSLSLAQNGLTIHGIVASDEGNYSCSYTAGPTLKSSIAGCLLVYGKASFASCRSTSYQSRCTEGIIVSNNGTLQFNLNLTFSTAGKAGLLQTVGRTIIRRTDEVILSIHSALVDTGNRQWTIEGNATTTTVTLENVVASDRGEYTIITELTDPATDYINTITKDVFATAPECSAPPETINGDYTSNGMIVSSTATYTCKYGYKLIGNSRLTCIRTVNDTYWSGDVPSCIKGGGGDYPPMFQLQIGPQQDCSCWSDVKSQQFLVAVKQQIAEGISETCNCSYTPSMISDIHLYCSQYPKYVSIRGFITGNEHSSTEDILRFMQIWRNKQSTVILTDRRVLNINKSCQLQISHWNEKECVPPPRAETCHCNSTVSE